MNSSNAAVVAPVVASRSEDHRVRVGRERREKMRAHLLQSVLSVHSRQGPTGSAVIEDVVKHAQVARGTFYKYFDSLEQAMSDLALQFATEMTVDILSIYDVLEDPVLRTATGFQMFLIRGIFEPDWGSFIAHIGVLSEDNLLTQKIRDDIRLGVETGDYIVPSVEIANDLLMGAKIEAIRRAIRSGGSCDYVQAMTAMVLCSLGVTPTKAEKSVARAFARLLKEAPGKVAWWQADAPRFSNLVGDRAPASSAHGGSGHL